MELTLLQRAEEAERATVGDEFRIISEAALAVFGWQDERYKRVLRLLEAGASLDAAMTLMVEGNGYQLGSEYGDEILPDSITYRLTGRHSCRVYTPNHGSFEAACATPALALTAAALKARAAHSPSDEDKGQ